MRNNRNFKEDCKLLKSIVIRCLIDLCSSGKLCDFSCCFLLPYSLFSVILWFFLSPFLLFGLSIYHTFSKSDMLIDMFSPQKISIQYSINSCCLYQLSENSLIFLVLYSFEAKATMTSIWSENCM